VSARGAAVGGGIARGARRARLRRAHRVELALVVLVLGIAALSLSLGAYAIPPADVLRTLLGDGTGREEFVVLELRLPRLTLGVLVGAALGMSGEIFQSVLRNPLASPDIIGVTVGASVAAVLALLVLGLGGVAVSAAAFGGALIVAAAIYLLAWRDGVSGARFVLIGVAVAFMAHAVLGYLLTRADIRDAQTALVWMVGSLSGAGWDEIVVVAVSLAVLVPAALVLCVPLRALELGDDTARGLGVRAQGARLGLIAVAVALAAVGTAAAGPVAFVAFVAGPIARRLVGSGPALVPAALVGMAVVTGADLLALHLLPGGIQVPVGIVTGLIGAPYLLWLLATTGRGEAR